MIITRISKLREAFIRSKAEYNHMIIMGNNSEARKKLMTQSVEK